MIYFRHTTSDREQADTDRANIERCDSQRNLSTEGRKMARDVGQAFKQYIAGHTKAQFTHSICPQCRDTIVRPKIEAMRGTPLA